MRIPTRFATLDVALERRAIERADSVVDVLAPAGWTDVRIEAWLDWAEAGSIPVPTDSHDRPLLGLLDGWADAVVGRGLDLGVVADASQGESLAQSLVRTMLAGWVAPDDDRLTLSVPVETLDDPASLRRIEARVAESRRVCATSGVVEAAARALNAVADAVDRCEGPRGECADPRKNPALARAALKARQTGASDAAILAAIAGERLSLVPAPTPSRVPLVVVAGREAVASGGPGADLLGQAVLGGDLVLTFDPRDGETAAGSGNGVGCALYLPSILTLDPTSLETLADVVRLWTLAMADRSEARSLNLSLTGLSDLMLREGRVDGPDAGDRLSVIAGTVMAAAQRASADLATRLGAVGGWDALSEDAA